MRIVEITPGITVLVNLGLYPDGRIVAVNAVTHTVCIGDTEDAALDTLRQTLIDDAAWYCEGRGSEMMLHGTQYQRREAVQGIFGCRMRGKV